ncbi:MAG: hypothetical protein VZR14_02305 [Hallerella sp.]|nr:hypothetical protein [Fibrobacter sp.]MEE3339537.1 hypothetical protein [Hallerella sp.]
MNTKNFCISVLLVATLGGAAYAQSMPESQVSSPVEESVSLDRTSLDAKNASWEQKRAERRAAREKILSRLRESSSQEKAMMREELSKNRGERPRMRGDFPKNEMKSPRNFDGDAEKRDMREDRRRMGPRREMQMPPAPEYGEPN